MGRRRGFGVRSEGHPNGMRSAPVSRSAKAVTPTTVREGDYFHSDRELFYVECRGFDRVILEDCRTGELIDAAVEEVRTLVPVRRPARQR
jgi:hypothetical protein